MRCFLLSPTILTLFHHFYFFDNELNFPTVHSLILWNIYLINCICTTCVYQLGTSTFYYHHLTIKTSFSSIISLNFLNYFLSKVLTLCGVAKNIYQYFLLNNFFIIFYFNENKEFFNIIICLICVWLEICQEISIFFITHFCC